MNVIVREEVEHAYYNIAAQDLNQGNTPPRY